MRDDEDYKLLVYFRRFSAFLLMGVVCAIFILPSIAEWLLLVALIIVLFTLMALM